LRSYRAALETEARCALRIVALMTSLRRERRNWFMLDFTFLLVTVAFFALAIFYVRGCALLK
jgi:hypothetical protein